MRYYVICVHVNEVLPDVTVYDVLPDVCDNQVVPGHSTLPHMVVGGIMFQVDTDNRSNFPTERSFHAFKKQRYTTLFLLSFIILHLVIELLVSDSIILSKQCN